MRNATDVAVTNQVSISRQLYNTNSASKIEHCHVLHRAVNVLRKHLNVPTDFQVRLANVKSRASGCYYPNHKMAVIVPKINILAMISTLAHEMVHAEQYHQGRLKNEYISGKGWVHEWNSELNTNKGTTYRAYRNQPWEVEAFDRQEGLAKIVAAELGL